MLLESTRQLFVYKQVEWLGCGFHIQGPSKSRASMFRDASRAPEQCCCCIAASRAPVCGMTQLNIDISSRAGSKYESTTQPLHLFQSCLVDSNNNAATVKKQHYHSVTNNTASQQQCINISRVDINIAGSNMSSDFLFLFLWVS